MKKEVMKKEEKKLKKGLAILIILILLFLFFTSLIAFTPKPNVAIIKIEGIILSGSQGFSPGIVSSDEIIELIEKIKQNERIKAVIFEINSPGGSAVASKEIGEAIKELKKEKLTVALIREVGASGAYWIASSCNYIIASPLSITGSIGVTASYLEYSRLLERLNITYQRLVAGEYKDIGTPYKNLTQEERALLEEILETVHKKFLNEIKENRNLSQEQIKEISKGMFYLGEKAKDLGLVDALGSRKDAITYIEKKIGIKAHLREYRKRGFSFFYDTVSLFGYWIGKGIVSIFSEPFKIFT